MNANERQSIASSRRFRWTVVILFFVAAAVPAVAFLNNLPHSGSSDREPSFEISRATTFYTEPLDTVGYARVAEAFYREFSHGIQQQDNAAVEILAAMGGRGAEGDVVEQPCRLLGIEPVPQHGDYFRTPDEYRRNLTDWTEEEWEQFNDEFARAQIGSWQGHESPLVVSWLESNDSSLDRIVLASHMPVYFVPRDPKRLPLLAMLLGDAAKLRWVARALVVRAMRSCGEAEYDIAWEDLAAAFRLSRLVAVAPSAVEWLVGCGIEVQACRGTVQWLNSLPPTYPRLEERLAELASFPKLRDYRPSLRFERIMVIDLAIGLERGSFTVSELGEMASHLATFDLKSLDWDLVLRRINETFDEMERLAFESDHGRRIALTEEHQRVLRNLSATLQARRANPLNQAVRSYFRLQKSREESDIFGQLFVCTFSVSQRALALVPPRQESEFELVKIAFVLTRHRLQEGHLPESLEAAGLPTPNISIADRFHGLPFRYVLDNRGGGWIFHVGANGISDSDPTSKREINNDDTGYYVGPSS